MYLRISCVGRVEALACTFDGVYCAGAVREKIYIWEVRKDAVATCRR